jgi:hypothetical protein
MLRECKFILNIKAYLEDWNVIAVYINRKGRFTWCWIMQMLLQGVVIGENRVTDGWILQRETEKEEEATRTNAPLILTPSSAQKLRASRVLLNHRGNLPNGEPSRKYTEARCYALKNVYSQDAGYVRYSFFRERRRTDLIPRRRADKKKRTNERASERERLCVTNEYRRRAKEWGKMTTRSLWFLRFPSFSKCSGKCICVSKNP